MGSIDYAALFEALGSDEATKVLRALNDHEPAPVGVEAGPPEEPAPVVDRRGGEVSAMPLITPSPEEPGLREAGQAMLAEMRRQGISAAGVDKDAA